MTIAKKIISYFLICLVLIFTLIAILGIWDIIDLEKVVIKVISSLIVVFASSAVVLFIFSVLVREDKKED
jgi:hypothetical protein